MTKPIGDKKPDEKGGRPKPTRVQKGEYVFDMHPQQLTRLIGKSASIFQHWMRHFPTRIAAQFGAIPTAYQGLPEDAAEIKRQGRRDNIPEAHMLHKEPPQPEV